MSSDDREPDIVARAIEKALISQAQVDECEGIIEKLVEMGLRRRTLAEILDEKGYLKRADLERLRGEVARARGEVIPGYKLEKRLGRGSSGVVYTARQVSLDRRVAIKVLYPELSRDPQIVDRFLREAKTVATLSHPNIVTGYDAGEANGYHYFVMEYVDGPTVAEVLSRGGAMSAERAIRIATQVARALDHAHEHGLVHKDVKPDNILLADGVAKLCDLGLVCEVGRERTDGTVAGTPHYISPETARGQTVDIRSDLYSLGATAYACLTGEPPFDGSTSAAILAKHIRDPAPNPCDAMPELSADVGRIVQRLLAKDPSARYQTPRALLRDLDRV